MDSTSPKPLRERMDTSRECPICEKQFFPYKNHPHALTCSKPCGARMRRSHAKRKPSIDKTCEVCGVAYSVQPWRADSNFCGRKCYGLRRRKSETRACLTCGTEFTVLPSNVKKYCKQECAALNNRGDKNPIWVKERTKPCAYCGSTMDAIGWRKRANCCSMACKIKWTAENGAAHIALIGTIKTYADGYKYVKTGKRSYTAHHRVVMEQHLGRKLKPSEHIHHRNGEYGDNRIENLEIMNNSNHRLAHHKAERIGLKVLCGEWVAFPVDAPYSSTEEYW